MRFSTSQDQDNLATIESDERKSCINSERIWDIQIPKNLGYPSRAYNDQDYSSFCRLATPGIQALEAQC